MRREVQRKAFMDSALEKTLTAGGSICAYGMIFPNFSWFASGAELLISHCNIYIAVSVIPGLAMPWQEASTAFSNIQQDTVIKHFLRFNTGLRYSQKSICRTLITNIAITLHRNINAPIRT
ncbi:hypothetical protein KAF44_17595 [Cupriavidus necator]|nr:hypothetical protein KAF44_17595 [Cupriavidus necator]